MACFCSCFIFEYLQGRKRIREGKNVATVLDEEIQNLVDKLKELGKSSRAKYAVGARSSSNFDQQVTILRRRLHKLGGLSEEKCVEKIPRIAVESLSMTTSSGVEVEGNNLVADGDMVSCRVLTLNLPDPIASWALLTVCFGAFIGRDSEKKNGGVVEACAAGEDGRGIRFDTIRSSRQFYLRFHLRFEASTVPW